MISQARPTITPRATTKAPTLPVIRIGGVAVMVTFAGLVPPGQFQFNVVVPASLADGDHPMTAAYSGSSTQAGVLLPVQR